MVKIPVGYKLIRDIADIQMAGKPNLMKDIGNLKANRTDIIVFNKFKKDYPELFDKTQVRNFSKKTPDSILGSVRRAYREGIDSTVSIWQINGIALREAYAPLRTTTIRKEKIRKLSIKLEEEEAEREEEYVDIAEIEEEPEYFTGLGRGKPSHTPETKEPLWIIDTILNTRMDLYIYFNGLRRVLGQDSLAFPKLYVVCKFIRRSDETVFYRTIGKVDNTPSSALTIENRLLDILNSVSDQLYDDFGKQPPTYGSIGFSDDKKDGKDLSIYILKELKTVFCQDDYD